MNNRNIGSLLIIGFIALALIFIFSGSPQAQYSTINYREAGGSSWVIGSGGTLTIADTSTAAAGLIYEGSRVVRARYAGDPNYATAEISIPGLDANDQIWATLNSATGGTYIKSVVPYSATAQINLASDPGGVIRISVWALLD